MPAFRSAKDKHQKPKIVFPAKLVIKGKVVGDELPGWNTVLRKRVDTSGASDEKNVLEPENSDHHASDEEENTTLKSTLENSDG